jgi:8-oxo-dGTP pyrophosphatase MutT (NUDIX family)
MSGQGFDYVDGETVWQGHIVSVHVERFRHPDGDVVTRERCGHPGAVAIVAHDDENVWLVRQPREPVRAQALLEIPAGKLDAPDEAPLETAKRELAEEIGKVAEHWELLTEAWASPGFSDERFAIYLATGLRDTDEPAEADENERIEIVAWPLERLDDLIRECEDAKSLIGLLWLRMLRA